VKIALIESINQNKFSVISENPVKKEKPL